MASHLATVALPARTRRARGCVPGPQLGFQVDGGFVITSQVDVEIGTLSATEGAELAAPTSPNDETKGEPLADVTRATPETIPGDGTAAASEDQIRVKTGGRRRVLAKPFDRGTTSSLTEAGQRVGTPIYMAPEMATTSPVIEASSDIFRLGILAFRLLARTYPFAEPPALACLERRSIGIATPMREACPSLDPAVAEIVDLCLALDPRARPAAREVAEQLSLAITTMPSATPEPVVA